MAAAHGITFSSWYPDMDTSMERRDASAGELLAALQEEVAEGLLFTGSDGHPQTALQLGQVSHQVPDLDHAGIEPWVKRAARAAHHQQQQQQQPHHTPHSSTPSAVRSESVYRRAQRIAHALDSEQRAEPQAPVPMRSLDPPLLAPSQPVHHYENKPTREASHARSSRGRRAHGRAETRRALDSDTAALMAELELLGKQLRTARRKIGRARHQVAEVAATTAGPARSGPSVPACACNCQAQHAAAHFAVPPNCMFCCDCPAKQSLSVSAPSQQHGQDAGQPSANVPAAAPAEHAGHPSLAAPPSTPEQAALPSAHASPAHSVDEQMVGRVLVELGLAADQASRLQEMPPEQRRAVRRAVRAHLRSLADGLDSTLRGSSSVAGATAEPGPAAPAETPAGPEPAAGSAAATSGGATRLHPAGHGTAGQTCVLPKQPQRRDTHARADRPTVEARDVYYIPPSCAAPLFVPRGLHSQRVPKRAGTTAGDPPRLATSQGQAVRAQPANRRTELPASRVVRRRAARYVASAAHRPSAASIMRNVETAAQQLVFATQQALLGR